MQDFALIEALRGGDESAFEGLVALYQASMLRVALLYVPTRLLAEEAVQETWIGVLKGLRRFEGRSSLKTWIFSILMNQAKTIAQREGRHQQIALEEELEPEATVSSERFQTANGDYPRHWQDAPESWDGIPEAILLRHAATSSRQLTAGPQTSASSSPCATWKCSHPKKCVICCA